MRCLCLSEHLVRFHAFRNAWVDDGGRHALFAAIDCMTIGAERLAFRAGSS